VAASICAVRRRGWRSVPVAMLAGGAWAVLPDLPGLVHDAVPDTFLARTLGARSLTQWFHEHGNLFFFHRYFDANYASPWESPRWGLRGILLILVAYNVMVAALFHAYRRKTKDVQALKFHLSNRHRKLLNTAAAVAAEAPEVVDRRAPSKAPVTPVASSPSTSVSSQVSMHGSPQRAAGRGSGRRRNSGDAGKAAAAKDSRTRREYHRTPTRQPVEAITAKPGERSPTLMANTRLLDVSHQGLALTTQTPVESGSIVCLRPQRGDEIQDLDSELRAVVLEQIPMRDCFKLRCRVIAGDSPARLLRAAA